MDVANISTYVVGEHGDSQVISWSNTIIEGDDIEKQHINVVSKMLKI